MARFGKCFKPLFHIVFLIIVSFILNKGSEKPVRKVQRFITDLKHILLWTKFPGIEEDGQEMLINKNCENINCYLTGNRSFLGDLRYFDAIIFNLQDIIKKDLDLPKVRCKYQKYIFAANHSSDQYPVCSSEYNSFFNWTWSYRKDSSISYHDIEVRQIEGNLLAEDVGWLFYESMVPISDKLKYQLQTKSKAATIFLNKCKTTSRREIFLRKLKHALKYYNLTIDVFGSCGKMRCDKTSMQGCFYRLKTNYYFYLNLEEFIAKDYISHEILYGYDNNAVPIVFGGAHYEKVLPPNSYLDARLLGVAALARTMYEIISNKEVYYEFFRWKNHYTIRKGKGMDICQLCLNMNNQKWLTLLSSYDDFRYWWNPDYLIQCIPHYGLNAEHVLCLAQSRMRFDITKAISNLNSTYFKNRDT